jgi:hypothetical protein
MGQFLPLFLQLVASAARLAAQMAAARIENKILALFFITELRPLSSSRQRKITLRQMPSPLNRKEGILID